MFIFTKLFFLDWKMHDSFSTNLTHILALYLPSLALHVSTPPTSPKVAAAQLKGYENIITKEQTASHTSFDCF